MASAIDPESDDYSDTDSDVDAPRDLRALPKLKGFNQPLSLEITYVPDWDFQDCFRELVQNWCDGMKDSFRLGKGNFVTVIVDSKKHWLARALHPQTRSLLGYIRFLKDKGMVELTNFNAQLARRTLNMGGGDKQFKEYLAGGHGEGYKAAAVVALRKGYQFRYEASSCYWNFHCGKLDKSPEQIYCHLQPKRPQPLQKTMKDYDDRFGTGLPRNETSYIHQDVSVKIGNVSKYKKKSGDKISERVFRKLIRVSLDLISPTTIATPYGELIVDSEFQDTTYLKRLLVEGNPGMANYKYGYHFFEGKIDRDRRRLPNNREDASRGAKIWEYVVEKQPEYLGKYIEMIEDVDSPWADVCWAREFVSRHFAEKMCKYYFDGDDKKQIFYHDSRTSDKDIEIITRSLRMTPAQLVPAMWDILRKYGLVRTPEEQQERLLNNAPEAADNQTPYSKSVKRTLAASLQLDPRTKGLNLSFRSGAKADLDLILCGNVIKINDLWLDFRASHRKTSCFISRMAGHKEYNVDCFSCHHVVLRLHELILEEVARQGKRSSNLIEPDDSVNERLRENLSQMPIMIRAEPGDLPCSISVSWTDLDPIPRLHGLEPKCRIVLHRESSCSLAREDLITADDFDKNASPASNDSTPKTDTCGCPLQIVVPQNGKIIFRDLDPREVYFPIIARAEAKAFYGSSPEGVHPSTPTYRSSLRLSAPLETREDLLEFDDMFDAIPNFPSPSTPLTPTKAKSPALLEPQTISSSEMALRRTPSSDQTSYPDFTSPMLSPLRPTNPDSTRILALTEPRSDRGADGERLTARHSARPCSHRLEVGGLREQLAVVNQELHNVKTAKQGLQSELVAKTETLKNTTSELETLQEQHRTEVDFKQALEEEVTRLQESIEDLNNQLRSIRRDNGDKLIRDLELTTETRRLGKCIESLNERLRVKEAELEVANLLVNELQSKDADTITARETLQEDMQRLKETNEQLEADLDKAQGINKNLFQVQADMAQLHTNKASRAKLIMVNTRASTEAHTTPTAIEREIKEDNDENTTSQRPSKRARLGQVIVID